MSEDQTDEMKSPEEFPEENTSIESSSSDDQLGRRPGWGRRELFRALASVPVFGALAYGVWRKTSTGDEKRRKIFEELGVTGDAPAVIPEAISNPPSEKLRLGVVGYGGGFRFNTARPDGAPRKLLDASALAAMGWRARTGLRAGLAATCEWYLAHTEAATGVTAAG